ncbi:WD40-repeat-containing domain protein [Paraphysoderma sedebokerense]|nr:WD40-repeat-containing domain protein [Paraphysoderma sedebokerense]
MISAICWVRKGVSATQPKKYDISDAELERIKTLANGELVDAKFDLEEALKDEEEVMRMQLEKTDIEDIEDIDNEMDNEDDDQVDDMEQDGKDGSEEMQAEVTPGSDNAANSDDLAIYNLDDYDDEPTFGTESAALFSNVRGLSYYTSNAEDPYITLKDGELSDEDREDLEILSTDNLLITAKTEEDISQLDIHIYESNEDNLYVHHDIMLPSFPLCLEWLDYKPRTQTSDSNNTGSFIAVGTFHPDIEIWDLDTIDTLYPETILGSQKTPSNGKKKRRKAKVPNEQYHVDAVMGLSWNSEHRNFIASASADTTVKIWDLSTSVCLRSYNHHTDKAQSVHWNPHNPTVLLTGSYDRTVKVFDSRSPDSVLTIQLPSDVENAKWVNNSSMDGSLYVSTEDGCVRWYDLKNVNGGSDSPSSMFTLQAHDGPCSGVEVNSFVPTMLVTGGGSDKKVKIWSIKNGQPSCVVSRDLGVGKVFDMKFCPDEYFSLAVAGSKGNVMIWDVGGNAGVRKTWSEEGSKFVGSVGERVVTKVEAPGDEDSEAED